MKQRDRYISAVGLPSQYRVQAFWGWTNEAHDLTPGPGSRLLHFTERTDLVTEYRVVYPSVQLASI